MVRSTRSNDPPSHPTRTLMKNTSLNVFPQQSPQTTPSHGTNIDEMVGLQFLLLHHQPFPLQLRRLQQLHNLMQILVVS